MPLLRGQTQRIHANATTFTRVPPERKHSRAVNTWTGTTATAE